MRSRGIRRGDVVEMAGDPTSLWLVIGEPTAGRAPTLRVQLRGRDNTARTVKARDVVAHWRRSRDDGRRS